MRLEIPGWFSAIDQRLIQSELDRVCPPVAWRDISGPAPLGSWVPEPVAVQNAVRVAQVVVSRLPTPLPKDRRQDLERLLAQIIDRIAGTRASPMSALPIFETMVKDALAECWWWPAFAKTKTPGAMAQRAAERQRVVLPILDALDWTPTKWAMESGVNPSVCLDYLAGTSTPRSVHRMRITETLAARVKGPFRLPD